MPLIIDKEEIFRDFFAYKIKSKSTDKLVKDRSSNLDKTLSTISKRNLSRGPNMVPIKTIRLKKDDSIKMGLNVSNSEFNRSKEKINQNTKDRDTNRYYLQKLGNSKNIFL